MAKRSNRQKERDSKDANQKYYAELAKEDPTAMTRKETINNAMKDQNINVSDMAKKTGLSIQSLMLFIYGRTNISSKYVTTIANLLQLDPNTIMKMPDLTSVAIHEAGLTMKEEKTDGIEKKNEQNEEKNDESEKTIENESKTESEKSNETEMKNDKKNNNWIPSDMEMNAILTLCTDIGKREVYNAIWNILQNPECRKGALC